MYVFGPTERRSEPQTKVFVLSNSINKSIIEHKWRWIEKLFIDMTFSNFMKVTKSVFIFVGNKKKQQQEPHQRNQLI